jgi:hypothetical protein
MTTLREDEILEMLVSIKLEKCIITYNSHRTGDQGIPCICMNIFVCTHVHK